MRPRITAPHPHPHPVSRARQSRSVLWAAAAKKQMHVMIPLWEILALWISRR